LKSLYYDARSEKHQIITYYVSDPVEQTAFTQENATKI